MTAPLRVPSTPPDGERMAPQSVELRWLGAGLEFEGTMGDAAPVTLDGGGNRGPSPVGALLLGIAGCMAADIVDIAQKMRVPLGGLHATVSGERRAEPPRRFVSLHMRFRAEGARVEDRDKLQRAVDLSYEKYCSVLHTLKDDIELTLELELAGGDA